jgi:hypothetical protein
MSATNNILRAIANLFAVALLQQSVCSASPPPEYFVAITPASGRENFPVTRVVITSATNQFALLAMPGYRVNNHPAESQIIFAKTDGLSAMTFSLLGFPPTAAKPWSAVITDRFPNGKIIQAAVATAAGQTGPMFDVAWRTPQGLHGISRIAFIPSNIGTLEFALTVPADKFPTAQYDLNNLMMTCRTAVNGQLDRMPNYGAAD